MEYTSRIQRKQAASARRDRRIQKRKARAQAREQLRIRYILTELAREDKTLAALLKMGDERTHLEKYERRMQDDDDSI